MRNSQCLINALTGNVGTRTNLSGNPTYQELVAGFRFRLCAAARTCLIRFEADAAKRGSARSRFTSASVAALTCARVLVRDRFAFGMVQLAANEPVKYVPDGTPAASFTRNHVLPTGYCLINALTGKVGTGTNLSDYPTNQELRSADRPDLLASDFPIGVREENRPQPKASTGACHCTVRNAIQRFALLLVL
jgi:hypothetical protein